MLRVVQTKAVADFFVKLVLSNMEFIVPISRTVGKIVGKTLTEYHLGSI